MQYNPDELNEILNIYKVESEEILQGFNDEFLELEKNPKDKTPLKRLFQLAHSLKGASRMIGFNSVQDISHKLEDILSYWKKDNVEINLESFQIIYEVCDFLGVLVEKSVAQKSNYSDEKVMTVLNLLDNFLFENKILQNEVPKQKTDAYISSKNMDINATLLELLFVLEKDNSNEDYEEVYSVIFENLKQLSDIFSSTNYVELKEQINALIVDVSQENNQKPQFSILKEKISNLKETIYNLFKDLNISNSVKEQIKNKKEEINQKNIVEADEKNNKDFDYILANLQKIKYEKKFLKDVVEILKNIVVQTDDQRISLILKKTINILDLFIKKDIIIDNDCYMVILQCIYLAKRISLKEKEENLNNLNFLIQRLSVVEDMFNVSDIQPNTSVEVKGETSVISQEDFSNIKKNLKSFDLQEIKTLRVDTSKLDNLISQTGELLINGIKTREHIVELSKINTKLLRWNAVSKKIINYLKYLEKKGFFGPDMDDGTFAFYKRTQDFFNANADVINEINNDFTNLYNIISEDDNKLHQTAVELETIAKGIRVLPLATIFHSFPRMIRDIAKENDKKIDFIVTGSDTTVDKKIIEEIKMPLIHILRNSVSHGIEHSEDRVKAGKPETGVIRLSARQAENNVIITIADDGYGINLEKVKEIALSKGLLTHEEIANMNSDQLMKLLFLPGFSTEDSVTEISGRGIGLDVVKTKITNLNGDILIDSVLGQGCKVTIRLPLSMSTIKTFILLVNNQKYAIPVSSVKFVKQVKRESFFKQNGQYCIIHDEHSVPVYSLSEILGEEETNINNKVFTVIIIENQEKQAAFVIDKLLGDQEVFQKKLIPPILRIKNISGFTTLSTGEICLIINPFELIRNTVLNIYVPDNVIRQLTTQNEQKQTNN